MTTHRRKKQKHQTALKGISMADNENPNAENESRSSGSRSHIYVTGTTKYNGTWYKNSVVEVDSNTANQLISKGAAREANESEIEEYQSRDENSSVLNDPRTARMLDLRNSPELAERFADDLSDIEPAVDEDGNEIPNSVMTDERKLRDSEGNTNTASVPQGTDAKAALKDAKKRAGL